MSGVSGEDSDHSARARSSSSSSSSDSNGEEERIEVRDTNRIRAVETMVSHPSVSGTAGEEDPNADPDSPSSNAPQSSEVSVSEAESSSSEGVLVEHPVNRDQESRSLQGYQDSGILVNIDGSMQDHPEEDYERNRGAEDTGREDTFVDAPDQLGFVETQNSRNLGESMALIEIGESSREKPLMDELAHVHSRLEETISECRKYKEERQTFGREVAKLRHQLQVIVDKQSVLVGGDNDVVLEHLRHAENEEEDVYDKALMSPTPLHAMLIDCSKLVSQVKSSLDEQLLSDCTIRELHAVLYTKDQEIEDLNMKVSEYLVSRDVVVSYLGSLRDIWSESLRESSDGAVNRLLTSLASVVPQEDDSSEELDAKSISLVEKRTAMLIERYTKFSSHIEQLGHCIAAVRPDVQLPQEKEKELDNVCSFACEELLESRRKESCLRDRINELEEERRKMVEQLDSMRESVEELKDEVQKRKVELEQTEQKLVTAKEKLGMAVSKGKSLVQHRDSLKQALAEKTSELESCLQELRQKSIALEAADAFAEELNKSQTLVLSLQDSEARKDKVLQDVEEVMSLISYPEEMQPLEVVDRVRWLVDQKQISEGVLQESWLLRDALSSFDLPENIASSALEHQINWLGISLSQFKDEISKLQDELAHTRATVASHESELHETQREISRLTTSVLEEKNEKDSLQLVNADLIRKHEEIVEKLSRLSLQKKELTRILVELSETSMDDQSTDDMDQLLEKCVGKIRERISSYFESSLAQNERFQRMQSLLYVGDQELRLCQRMLEEEVLGKVDATSLLNQLQRVSEEIITLTNERDSLQKDLEQLEGKSSILREKLSMAVKKGKGLVQEREGFKLSLDEKNSEIAKLNNELHLRDSEVVEYKEQINFLLDNKNKLQIIIDSIENIDLPTDMAFEDPLQKVKWIEEHISVSSIDRLHVKKELEKLKEESALQTSKLGDAYATAKLLEDKLHQAENQLSIITEEKNDINISKTSAEQELQRVKEEADMLASRLAHARATIKSLEGALEHAENNMSSLMDEKSKAELKSKEEIKTLNVKLAAHMEELAGTHGNLENQSSEMVTNLKHLHTFLKDKGLLLSMTEGFKKKIELLRNMSLLVQNIHEKSTGKGLQRYPDSEKELGLEKLFSLPNLEDYDRVVASEISKEHAVDNIPSFKEVIEGFSDQAKTLGDRFAEFASYIDAHIKFMMEALQEARDEFINMLELNESLKLHVNKLEADNQAQEVKISAIQSSMAVLLSACTDATQNLQRLESAARGNDGDGGQGQDESHGDDGQKTAEDLLLAVRGVIDHVQQFANVKSLWMTDLEDMRNKLKVTELTAETAIEERNLKQKQVSKLEGDLEELQNLCSELKLKIEDYLAKEVMWGTKEAQLVSLHRKLADIEIFEKLFSEGQLESLLDMVNEIEIPFKGLDMETQEILQSPTGKLFYVVNNFAKLCHVVDSMSHEKEDLQSVLVSHVNEIEHLKKEVEITISSNLDLENKKNDLIELTEALERIIQRFGVSYLFDDDKPAGVKGLVWLLERFAVTTTLEADNSKSRAQELGAKLQANQMIVDELSSKVKSLEDSIHARPSLSETGKERGIFQASSSATASEISEIEDTGQVGKNSVSPGLAAAHVRTMRKGSNDHLVVNIGSESDRLISSPETEDKGHVFKSLNTSGLIPKQGKLIADRIDGIWVSGGRLLMGRPGARMSLIAYWILLHIWVLGTIL